MLKPYRKMSYVTLILGYPLLIIGMVLLSGVAKKSDIIFTLGYFLIGWGCWALAKGKGYHSAWGLFGIINLAGPIVLAFFKDRNKSYNESDLYKLDTNRTKALWFIVLGMLVFVLFSAINAPGSGGVFMDLFEYGSILLHASNLLVTAGCIFWVKAKGYHFAWGFLGLLNIFGIIILMFFKDRKPAEAR